MNSPRWHLFPRTRPTRSNRIVVVTTVVETLLLLMKGHLEALARNGFEVVCVAAEGTWFGSWDSSELGARFYVVPFERRRAPWRDIKCLGRLLRLLAAERPAHLLYSTPKAALISSIAGWILGVPARTYLNTGLLYGPQLDRSRSVYTHIDRVICRLSHRVISVSRSNRDCLLAARVCPAEKLQLLANGSSHGVDARGRFDPRRVTADERNAVRDEVGIPRQSVVFGFVGRLTRDKGVPELLSAWRSLTSRHAGLNLMLIGPRQEPRDNLDGDEWSYMESCASVHLIGATRDLPRYYAAMDILALPSHREGFPNVVLEAGAMELPVITTDALGCVDSVIDDLTGLIYPMRNVGELVRRMELLLRHPDLRRRLGQAARRRALTEFDPERISQELVKLLKAPAVEHQGTLRRSMDPNRSPEEDGGRR